ncbi:hypothetical protein KB206_00310 [Microvirga sp. STS02]|uniref:hypothetical protein n=1 Tax=Hymenobacter negativus TaxID=2795026 RepID=UPI0018DC0124|nr:MULTISPECIES: hypothetical protein [Bacteria]MBH8567307.1 hypothetical protein [Hymenobacter negativus]MBR7207039.1 hypothetical protein [Microvirga sp. STS02]
MSYETNQLANSDSGLVVSVNGKRLRPVTSKEALALEEAEMDYRFVREVEHLERSGRVAGRGQLEADLFLPPGSISLIRSGHRSIGKLHIKRLFELYRGDYKYILFGVRDKEHTGSYISGIGNIDKYVPYIHSYPSPARWKVGPRPETHPEYCMKDPNNEQWQPPTRESEVSKARRSKKNEQ